MRITLPPISCAVGATTPSEAESLDARSRAASGRALRLREHAVGIGIADTDETLLALYLGGQDGEDARMYAMSLTRATCLIADLTSAIESRDGITSLVRETLRHG